MSHMIYTIIHTILQYIYTMPMAPQKFHLLWSHHLGHLRLLEAVCEHAVAAPGPTL